MVVTGHNHRVDSDLLKGMNERDVLYRGMTPICVIQIDLMTRPPWTTYIGISLTRDFQNVIQLGQSQGKQTRVNRATYKTYLLPVLIYQQEFSFFLEMFVLI